MSDAGPAVALHDICFTWAGSDEFQFECDAFTLAAGSSVLLLGASGSGKSTLLSLICGINSPQSGQIHVAGTNITTLGSAARDRFRAENIGVIFQQFNLLPYAVVADNIELPLRFAPQRKARASKMNEAASLCSALGLPDDILSRTAGSLSVGQQQRVAVARALIGQPPLIVADEPTSALDANSQNSFLKVLFDQVSRVGASLLMASHDERLGERFDRVVRLEDLILTTGAA